LVIELFFTSFTIYTSHYGGAADPLGAQPDHDGPPAANTRGNCRQAAIQLPPPDQDPPNIQDQANIPLAQAAPVIELTPALYNTRVYYSTQSGINIFNKPSKNHKTPLST
jgi:hypothetical protein